MKRLLITLLIVLISASVFAGDNDVLSSKMNVIVNVNPSTVGGLELQNAAGTAYGTSDSVKLGLNGSATGTGTVYLYFYSIGPATISLKINSALKNTNGGRGSDNMINYSITLSKEDGNKGSDFDPTGISSNNTKETSAKITTTLVRTSGRYKMVFATTDNIQSKNYGTYKSTIEVVYTSTT